MPFPAGGLFSTATDVSQFCRMILNDGVLNEKRYLSEKSLQQMTSTQTGSLPVAYGFGWFTDRQPGGSFGHGGAHKTDMHIFPQQQLVTVFMVQNTDWRNGEGGKVLPTFQQAAIRAFGITPPAPNSPCVSTCSSWNSFGLYIARMRVELGEHPVDGGGDKLFVVGFIDIFFTHARQYFPEKLQVLINLRVCWHRGVPRLGCRYQKPRGAGGKNDKGNQREATYAYQLSNLPINQHGLGSPSHPNGEERCEEPAASNFSFNHRKKWGQTAAPSASGNKTGALG